MGAKNIYTNKNYNIETYATKNKSKAGTYTNLSSTIETITYLFIIQFTLHIASNSTIYLNMNGQYTKINKRRAYANYQ